MSLESGLGLYRAQPYEIERLTGAYRQTDATVEPITVAELREYARIDETTEDSLLSALICAARTYCENYTRRAFISQTWIMYLSKFPSEPIYLARSPLISVSSITYQDSNGTTQTWSSGEYSVDKYGIVSRISPAYGYQFPTARTNTNSVTITFTAGYGTTAASVPEPLRLAVKFLAGHWYENRQPIVTGTIVADIPFTVEALLDQYKIVELR